MTSLNANNFPELKILLNKRKGKYLGSCQMCQNAYCMSCNIVNN